MTTEVASTLGTPAPSAAPAVDSTPAVAPASQPTSWKDSLPDDIKADPSLKAIEDINNLAKSYVHSQRLIGKDKIVVPNEHSTEQEWQSIYKKLGLPEDMTKYEIKGKEGEDAAYLQSFKESLYKVGVLPKQAQAIYDHITGQAVASQKQAHEKYTAENTKALADLQKNWGEKYNSNVELAQRAVEAYGGEKLRTYLNQTGLGNEPLFIEMFAKIGETLKEDKISGDGGNSMGRTPDEINGEIRSIMQDNNSPYYDKAHPNHAEVVNRVSALYARLS